MQVLRLKELERQQQHNHNTNTNKNTITNTNTNKLKHSLLKAENSDNNSSECCILAHREYFEIGAYHSKIIERSCLSSSELKTMKLKQSAIKLDNRKSNQLLKQLKTEIEKKQTYLTELSKNITASNEQFNGIFKQMIQLCSVFERNHGSSIKLN